MATPNGRGGWDLTDSDVDAIAAASGFPGVERDEVTGLTESETVAVVAELEGKGMVPDPTYGDPHRTQNVAADPAYTVGRVDFSEMLTSDAQWSLKHRFDELLGRPYLSTQLAAMLPADVALRLVERAEHVITQRVQAGLDQIANELNRTTEEAIDRMAKTAEQKLKELRNERFKPTRLG